MVWGGVPQCQPDPWRDAPYRTKISSLLFAATRDRTCRDQTQGAMVFNSKGVFMFFGMCVEECKTQVSQREPADIKAARQQPVQNVLFREARLKVDCAGLAGQAQSINIISMQVWQYECLGNVDG